LQHPLFKRHIAARNDAAPCPIAGEQPHQARSFALIPAEALHQGFKARGGNVDPAGEFFRRPDGGTLQLAFRGNMKTVGRQPRTHIVRAAFFTRPLQAQLAAFAHLTAGRKAKLAQERRAAFIVDGKNAVIKCLARFFAAAFDQRLERTFRGAAFQVDTGKMARALISCFGLRFEINRKRRKTGLLPLIANEPEKRRARLRRIDAPLQRADRLTAHARKPARKRKRSPVRT